MYFGKFRIIKRGRLFVTSISNSCSCKSSDHTEGKKEEVLVTTNWDDGRLLYSRNRQGTTWIRRNCGAYF